MNLLRHIDAIQALIDHLRAEATFQGDRNAYQAGAEHFADQVELVIARRMEALNNWTPALHGATRKHELHQLREAIRSISIPSNQ